MLRLESVEVDVGGFRVLRDVSLFLAPATTTLLVGRNGAGKTTTLRTIMGLLPLREGRLTIDEADLAAMPPYRRAALGIGYAPEDRRLIPEFSVEENLLFPTFALNLPRQLAQERLEAVYALLPELTGFKDRAGGHLSGGQGKMVALGRALMAGTRFVLLDEPFQGLAPALARTYADALTRVRKKRPDLSLLITESSPHLIEDWVDTTLRIERGHVTERAPSEAT
jgi:ABC-type branched-subunit amino acid transport system ATPase component